MIAQPGLSSLERLQIGDDIDTELTWGREFGLREIIVNAVLREGVVRREKGIVNVYDLGSLFLTTDRSHLALDFDNKKGRHFLIKSLGTPSAPSASASITVPVLYASMTFIQSFSAY